MGIYNEMSCILCIVVQYILQITTKNIQNINEHIATEGVLKNWNDVISLDLAINKFDQGGSSWNGGLM